MTWNDKIKMNQNPITQALNLCRDKALENRANILINNAWDDIQAALYALDRIPCDTAYIKKHLNMALNALDDDYTGEI